MGSKKEREREREMEGDSSWSEVSKQRERKSQRGQTRTTKSLTVKEVEPILMLAKPLKDVFKALPLIPFRYRCGIPNVYGRPYIDMVSPISIWSIYGPSIWSNLFFCWLSH